MTSPLQQQPLGDRRPIATRNRPVVQRLAGAVARSGVSANGISVLGMLAGLLGAGTLVLTNYVGSELGMRLLFGGSAAFIQLRLLANMLDGMVAVASGKASAVGELYNELPDRISDTAILVGAGYAVTGVAALGWAAACLALFVTYIRAVGKTMGVAGLFQGPMSKSHRMFTLTCACVVMAVVPYGWLPVVRVGDFAAMGVMSFALLLILFGGVVTAYRRLARILKAIRERT